MESTRDIRRMIEKEIKKGSAPLTFDHIDYRPVWQHVISFLYRDDTRGVGRGF